MDTIKVPVDGFLKPVALSYVGNRIVVKFPFDKGLIKWVKTMEGYKWDGPKKQWTIANSQRNRFQISNFKGENPYAPFDAPLLPFTAKRPEMREHQLLMASHAMTRRFVIWACEMGLGKSLSMIECIEFLQQHDGLLGDQVWYVGPRSGVNAVGRELVKWDATFTPHMMTYEGMVSKVQTWDGSNAPRVIVFDESSKLKTPTSQRSQAAMHVANASREEWGDKAYVILMSGSPAPKSPVDWWNQCEIACPGFIKEGSIAALKNRLSIIEYRESLQGGTYPHQVAWLDDEEKCAKCGLPDLEHDFDADHGYVKSVNEVLKLNTRMDGLVLTMFKKDVLDLPEKLYSTIRIKPTVEMIRGSKMIKDTSSRAIEALTRLRELSDGFGYGRKRVDDIDCTDCCNGKVTMTVPVSEIEVDKPQDTEFEEREVECDVCFGTGKVAQYEKETYTVESPKDAVLKDILSDHNDADNPSLGRLVVWGGFTASIDRIVDICHESGWCTLRIDGRGLKAEGAMGEIMDAEQLLCAMDRSHPDYERLCDELPPVVIVGHPQAAGMAYTFTAASTAVYYSNCFSGEARIQSEDRVHRLGMALNKGCNIIDLILLPTDQLVLNNLQNKRRLQDLTMGELKEYDDAIQTVSGV